MAALVLATFGLPVRAITFPTIQDNTACARLVVAGEEVIVASHGSFQPTGSIEIINFTASGAGARRLAAPDGAAASNCSPIEDTDLVAVIPPSRDAVKVYGLEALDPAGYMLTLRHTLPATGVTVVQVLAVSDDGAAAVVRTSSTALLLRDGQAPQAFAGLNGAGWTAGGFIVATSAGNQLSFSAVDGSSSVSLPSDTFSAFDSTGVWLATPSAGLRKHALPSLGVAVSSAPLNGFASLSRLMVSKAGHGVVIGQDARNGWLVMRFHPDGTAEPPVHAVPQFASCYAIDSKAERGIATGGLDFLLDMKAGVVLGNAPSGEPLAGATFVHDRSGRIYSARADIYFDGIEVTPADLLYATWPQTGEVLPGVPLMVASPTGNVSANVSITSPTQIQVQLSLRSMPDGVSLNPDVRVLDLAADTPATLALTVSGPGARFLSVNTDGTSGRTSAPAVQPMLLAAEPRSSLPAGRAAELEQTYADTIAGLLDPRMLNVLLDLPVTAFQVENALHPSSRFSNPHEWTLWLQTIAQNAAKSHPERWDRVAHGLSSILTMMADARLFDATKRVWKYHYYTLKDDMGADYLVSGIPDRMDGGPSADDAGLSVHNIWLIKSMAAGAGRPDIVAQCNSYLNNINVSYFLRPNGSKNSQGTPFPDGTIAQVRNLDGTFAGDSNFDTRADEGWLILSAMVSLGQINRAELITAMKALKAGTSFWRGIGTPAADFDSGLFLRALPAILGHPVTPEEAAGATGYLGTVGVAEANRQFCTEMGFDAPYSPAMDTGVEYDPNTQQFSKPIQIRGPANMTGAPPSDPAPSAAAPKGYATASVAPFAVLTRISWCPDALRDWNFAVLDKYRASYYLSGLGWISSWPFKSGDPFPGYDGKRIGLLNSCYIALTCREALDAMTPLSAIHPAKASLVAMTTAIDRGNIDSLPALTATITAAPSSAAGGMTSGGGVFALGSTVTLVATPAVDHVFVNWTENGIPVSTSASYSFNASLGRALVAKFISINADLESLVFSPGTLTPTFSTNTTSYTVNIFNSNATVTVTPAAADSAATVKISVAGIYGAAGDPIDMNVGQNVINVVVTAEDVSVTKAYTITVTRAAPAVAIAAVAGSYRGLLTATPASPIPIADEGLVQINLMPTGTFTGWIKLNGLTLPLTGRVVAADGGLRFGVLRTQSFEIIHKAKPVNISQGRLELTVETAAGINRIIGKLVRNATVVAELASADQALYTSRKNPAPPFMNVPKVLADPFGNQGRYTALFRHGPALNHGLAADRFPQGDGWALMTILSSGNVAVVGRLADGSLLSYGGPLVNTNVLPIYVQLYVLKQGFISGAVVFDPTQTQTDASAVGMKWFKPANATDSEYRDGWPDGIGVDLMASKLVLPITRTAANPNPLYVLGTDNILGLQAAPNPAQVSVALADGGVPTFSRTATVDARNKLTLTGAGVTLGFNAVLSGKSGTLAGAFIHPVSKRTVNFAGVVFQKTHAAGGYFLYFAPKPLGQPAPPGISGSVSIAP
jgi:hypothetical protein